MATYTGDLHDITGIGSLAAFSPKLTVRPDVACWGPDGPVVDSRVDVPLSGAAFSMELIPSTQLVGPSGVAGVGYVLECVLFATAADGSQVNGWRSEWRFNALPGGGDIADMIGVPANPGPPYWTLVTDAELDARVAGLVGELDLAQAVKSVHLVSSSGRWWWDGRGHADATHYIVRRDGRWVIVATPFPVPSASAPAITW